MEFSEETELVLTFWHAKYVAKQVQYDSENLAPSWSSEFRKLGAIQIAKCIQRGSRKLPILTLQNAKVLINQIEKPPACKMSIGIWIKS